MRYYNRTAFLKQIKNAKLAGSLSRIYWVAVSSDYERIEVVEQIVREICSDKKNVHKWTEFDPLSLGNHLQTLSLLGDEPVALIENAEKMTTSDKEAFRQLLPQSFGYLICSAKSKCPLSDLVETVGVVLDLLLEKPWEKEKRMQQIIEQMVLSQGKMIAIDAIQALMEGQDLEEGIFAREVEKLVSYCGDRSKISREDVAAICTPNRTPAIWQIAEQVVWERKGLLDEAHFHALIPALRSQLEMGLKMASLLATQASSEEWSAALPKVFPKTLEKRTKEAGRLGLTYFARGLEVLFEIELASRMGVQHLSALLDFFHCTLSQQAKSV